MKHLPSAKGQTKTRESLCPVHQLPSWVLFLSLLLFPIIIGFFKNIIIIIFYIISISKLFFSQPTFFSIFSILLPEIATTTSNKIRAIIPKDLCRTAFMCKCCRFGVSYTLQFLGKF